MKKRSIVLLGVAGLLLAGGLFVKWKSPKSIDFVSLMPETLIFCKTELGPGSVEYDMLVDWFRMNRDGWKNSTINFFPETVIYNKGMTINIVANGVVVDYRNGNRPGQQVVKDRNPEELNFECAS